MGGACHKTSISCQPFLELIFEFSVFFCLEFDTWLKARTRPTRLSRSLGNSSNTSGLIFVPQADLRPEKKQRPETDPQYDGKHWQLVSPLFTMLLHLWQDWQLSYNINQQNHIIGRQPFGGTFQLAAPGTQNAELCSCTHARAHITRTHTQTTNARTHTRKQTNTNTSPYMHIHIQACVYAQGKADVGHTHTNTSPYVHIHIQACVRAQGRADAGHTHTQTSPHTDTHTQTQAHTHACTFTYMHMCVFRT